MGLEHEGSCLYAGPPLARDRRRTGVTGLVTRADCEGRGKVHTNASLGLLVKALTPFAAWGLARSILRKASEPGADYEALASAEASLQRGVLEELSRLGTLGRREASLVRAALHVAKSEHPRWG